MEFSQFSAELDELKRLAEEETDRNEADTRGDLVEPLIRVLGYRVKREYEADWGDGKKKVDLAILNDEEPYVVVECKSQSTDLRRDHVSQLNGYFTFTSAQVGILTNGVKYEIYLDTSKENVMDERPFFTFDLIDSDEADRRTIHRLDRRPDGLSDLEGFRRDVETMGFKREAKEVFEEWLTEPDEEFGRLLQGRTGVSVEGALGQLAQQSFREFVDGKIGSRVSPDSPPISTEGERSLTEWNPAMHGKPNKMTFPDGDDESIGKQYEIEVKATRWLIENGFLTRASLPIQRASKFLVNETATHPDGKNMTLPHPAAPWAFVECAYSLPNRLVNVQTIIRYAGQDPAQFKFS